MVFYDGCGDRPIICTRCGSNVPSTFGGLCRRCQDEQDYNKKMVSLREREVRALEELVRRGVIK